MRWTLPKMSFSSWSTGVALSTIWAPFRSTVICRVSTGAIGDDALHIGKAVDLLSVDRHDHVAGLEARGGGRASRLHVIDARAHGLHAIEHEDRGKNHYG